MTSEIAAFGREFVKPGAVDPMFHAYLIDAQEARNISDYQTVTHLTKEGASLHLRRAEDFLEMAAVHFGPNPVP